MLISGDMLLPRISTNVARVADRSRRRTRCACSSSRSRATASCRRTCWCCPRTACRSAARTSRVAAARGAPRRTARRAAGGLRGRAAQRGRGAGSAVPAQARHCTRYSSPWARRSRTCTICTTPGSWRAGRRGRRRALRAGLARKADGMPDQKLPPTQDDTARVLHEVAERSAKLLGDFAKKRPARQHGAPRARRAGHRQGLHGPLLEDAGESRAC